MDKAKDIEEFIKGIAEYLSMGEKVRFDHANLQYGVVSQAELDEYGHFLDPKDEYDLDDLAGWEKDVVEDIEKILELPDSVDPPMNGMKIDRMVDFINQVPRDLSLVRDVERALHGRHPFQDFKAVMRRWRMEKEWYVYRDACYEDYTRHELRFFV